VRREDPSGDLRGALPPVRGAHHAALTKPAEHGGCSRAIRDYQSTFIARCALRLAALLFVRPGELRKALNGQSWTWRERSGASPRSQDEDEHGTFGSVVTSGRGSLAGVVSADRQRAIRVSQRS